MPDRSKADRARRSGRAALLCALIGMVLAQGGCGALLLVGGAGTSAIAFATGELRVTEAASLTQVHDATRLAVETLRYADAEAVLTGDNVRWTATTAGGDPVDIRLYATGPEQTELRIRIGIFGNEARSRLVLEQIRQSL
ncbi:MAG: DUF3568 family protein [bacterium]